MVFIGSDSPVDLLILGQHLFSCFNHKELDDPAHSLAIYVYIYVGGGVLQFTKTHALFSFSLPGKPYQLCYLKNPRALNLFATY